MWPATGRIDRRIFLRSGPIEVSSVNKSFQMIYAESRAAPQRGPSDPLTKSGGALATSKPDSNVDFSNLSLSIHLARTDSLASPLVIVGTIRALNLTAPQPNAGGL